ncbi:MAG: PH domain-containing protein [Actinomycetota bacterium]
MAPETKRYVTRAAVTIRAVFGITFPILGLALLQEWNNGRMAGVEHPSYPVQAVVLFAVGMWDLVGALRAGIWADPDGITVRDTVRTRRIAWADIASFKMDAFSGVAAKCLRVHLRNGKAIRVWSILEPRFGRKYKTSIVQELNDALVRAMMPARPDAR